MAFRLLIAERNTDSKPTRRKSKGKLRMPTRPKPEKLMTEERVNWYLRQLENPPWRMGLTRDGNWEEIKEKLTSSLNIYKIPIPDTLK